MKSLKTLLCLSAILVLFNSCATTAPLIYFGMYGKVTLTNRFDPKKMVVAVMPCKSSGNPNEKISWEITDKFEEYLRTILEVNVISRTWVEGKINELGIDPSNLSLSDLKRLQQGLGCNSICIPTVNYEYIPASSSSYGYGYANRSYAGANTGSFAKEGQYYPISESVSIVDAENQITALTGRVELANIPYDKGMAFELVWSIRRVVYNQWPKKEN